MVRSLTRQMGFLTAFASLCLFASHARAATIGFVNSPTTNSIDFAAFIASNGAIVNTAVNFDTHPAGPLDGNFYSGLGVTLIATGDVNTVQFGAGPGQSNTSTTPLSPGEGPHAPSNFLFDNGGISNLIISFATPVFGAGLFTIDHFNPFAGNTLTIEAFSGQNATGASLGLFNSAAFNFQPNNLYFMGIGRTEGDIGSIRFTDVNTQTGDTIGIDDIRFGTGGTVTPVPEPTSLLLLGSGVAVLVARARKRGQQQID